MSKSINKERMIEMKKEEKYYQIYRIHLLNGEVIEASEEYDLPVEKGLVGKFQKADDNKVFEIGDPRKRSSGYPYPQKAKEQTEEEISKEQGGIE